MEEKIMPHVKGYLRDFMLTVPKEIYACSGIGILGRRIKSLLFSTDASIIRNTNADAVIAVYPFTPQPIITQAVMTAADVPVFVGVGGGLTQGQRVINLALHAEYQGALGVVVNAPTQNEVVRELKKAIDIPVVVTVVSDTDDIEARIEAGADIFLRRQNSAACGKDKGESPRFPDNRNGRSDGREHNEDDRGRRKRYNLDSALKRRSI